MRRIDALLVLMVLIWGVNYSVIKHAFREIPPQPFNAMRISLASLVFLTAIRVARQRARTGKGSLSSSFYTPTAVSKRDFWDLIWLGRIGHCGYQYCFVGGVAQASVSNAALIIGATPVAVAVMSALLGRERIAAWHWLGAAVSVTGIYFVVGRSAECRQPRLRGS